VGHREIMSLRFHTPEIMSPPQKPRGAAILAAMLTVTLVATLAAAAVWRQFRATEVEAAERARAQLAWVLVGALDWARLILREDARSGGPDHLAEPWAVPLAEARLSSFLAAEGGASNIDAAAEDAFMSGAIEDAQGKFNMASLLDGSRINTRAVETFIRLLNELGLSTQIAQNLPENLRFAADRSAENLSGNRAPLMPQRLSDLSRFGLDATTLDALAPHAVWLPQSTPVNLNTATPEVLAALVPGLDVSKARQLARMREREPFRNTQEFVQRAGLQAAAIDDARAAISSRYFIVTGSLRIGTVAVVERSLVYREGLEMRVIWRERGTQTLAPS
jgi:general secretion pathway protein K